MPTFYRQLRASRTNRPKLRFVPSKPANNIYTVVGDLPLVLGLSSSTIRTTIFPSSLSLTLGLASTSQFSHIETINNNSLPLSLGLSSPFSKTFAPSTSLPLILSLSSLVEQLHVTEITGDLPLTLGLASPMTALLVTPAVTTVEGVKRNQIFKRFLRETGLGVYGTVTGIGGGATISFDDATRLKSTQFTTQDWVGAWSRISKNASSVGTAPEGEFNPVTAYDPTTNGRITSGTFTAIEVADEYELWRMPHPQTVVDDLDVVLQEDIFLPCWTILSDHPDFDMEQTGTSDYTAVTGSITKVSSGNPYMAGKRYLALTTTSTVGLWKSASKIKVEPNKKYHLSIVGMAADANNILTLSAYDETNGSTIQSVTWDRQYPGRMKMEFTTPSTCHQITVRGGHDNTVAVSYWDELCFYQTDAYDIALPWWVKNKNQVKGIFDVELQQISTDVYDSALRGNVSNRYNIRDDAFGSGQLRLISETGSISGPIFIFGVRNETAYSDDNADTKRVDANLIIACLAYKVFKRLKIFPNSNAMQTQYVQQQYNEWEGIYKRLLRQQSERIENIIQTIPPSGHYIDQRFNWNSN